MKHAVLLVSHDESLHARVRQALPAGIAIALHCAPGYQPPPPAPPGAPTDWLLILIDEAALPASEAPDPGWAAATAPIIWLGQAGNAGAASAPPLKVLDAVGRDANGSKLALILRQHFATAYLKRVRSRALAPPPPRLHLAAGSDEPGPGPQPPIARQREFNNALTGLMGNAELALQGSARLPQALRLRLQRICELAGRLRDLSGPGAGDTLAAE